MNPIRHPSNNRTLGAPVGWDQSGLPVEPLGVTDTVIGGVPCVLSFWQPDAVDLVNIAAGRPVGLSIVGRTMPPAALVTFDPEPGDPVQPASTPAANWRADGALDPHGTHYDCERAALTLGGFSDDELANAAFMNYDHRPPLQDIVDGKAHSPIVYMTAVKERIRWLSRALEAAIADRPQERAAAWLVGEAADSELDSALAASKAAPADDIESLETGEGDAR